MKRTIWSQADLYKLLDGFTPPPDCAVAVIGRRRGSHIILYRPCGHRVRAYWPRNRDLSHVTTILEILAVDIDTYWGECCQPPALAERLERRFDVAWKRFEQGIVRQWYADGGWNKAMTKAKAFPKKWKNF